MLGVGNRMVKQDASRLGDGLNDQDTGHDHFPGKMSLEKGLIAADVLEGDNGPARLELLHPVHEKEREPVGEMLQDPFNGDQGGVTWPGPLWRRRNGG